MATVISNPNTPTLGSALVNGGLEDRARVHSLLQSLAATAEAADAHARALAAASRQRGRGKRKRSQHTSDAQKQPHKQRQRQKQQQKKKCHRDQVKGSRCESPRATRTSETQRRPRSSASLLETGNETPTRAEEQSVASHQAQSSLPPPPSFDVEWTEGVELPEACEPLPPHQTTPVTSTTTASAANDEQWDELVSELYYHFGARRGELDQRYGNNTNYNYYYNNNGWGQQTASSSLLRLHNDDAYPFYTSPPPPRSHHTQPFHYQLPQQENQLVGEGYLLHW